MALQTLLAKEHVPGSRLLPAHLVPGRITGAFEKLSLDRPLGRVELEVRLDRTEYPIRAGFLVRVEQIQQPILRRKLIVIDEGNKVAVAMLDRFIPGERDVLPRLRTVGHRHLSGCGKPGDHRLRRLRAVVVGHHDRIAKEAAGLQTLQRCQRPLEKSGTPQRTDANADVMGCGRCPALRGHRRFLAGGGHRDSTPARRRAILAAVRRLLTRHPESGKGAAQQRSGQRGAVLKARAAQRRARKQFSTLSSLAVPSMSSAIPKRKQLLLSVKIQTDKNGTAPDFSRSATQASLGAQPSYLRFHCSIPRR